MTKSTLCKKCGGWGSLCLCPEPPGPICYICTLALNPHIENTYTREDGQRCHSDCLIREAESQGFPREAARIQERDLVARFQKSEFL